MAASPLIPEKGNRVLLVGKTGSGKTAFATWLLQRMEQSPIIIYDTKIESKFEALPSAAIVGSHLEARAAREKGDSDYIVIRPSMEEQQDPEQLDALLLQHYYFFEGCPAYIDEIYHFHKSGRPGPGLVGVLTRGRSKGITTIMSTQRPAWLSGFCLTETDLFYILRLTDRKDRKRFDDIIEDFSLLPKPQKYGFWFFSHEVEKPIEYGPIKLADNLDTGYTDIPGKSDAEEAHKSVWI